MEIEYLKCKRCGGTFKVNKSGKKRSNLAWERFYENGSLMMRIVCYKCYRYTENSKRNPEDAKKYEKTKSGFLMRAYRNMKSRILGIQKRKNHLYKNKEILNKEDFYKWANDSEEFHRLFTAWEKSNYDRKLTPSVDRIDSGKGYILKNMEWVTHSENSRRGASGSKRKTTA